MNFSFLPEKIKKELLSFAAAGNPISVVRSGGSLDGDSGESYMIAYDDKIFLFSRKSGEDNYLKISGGTTGEIASVNLRKDKYNVFFDVNISGKPYSMKFSSFDEKDLQTVMDAWKKKVIPAGVGADLSDSAENRRESQIPAEKYAHGSLSPMLVLAAAMMYISFSNKQVTEEEDSYIISALCNNKNILTSALQYFKTHSYDQFLADIGTLNEEQKFCILANIVEIGMKDGVFDSTEQGMIKKFASTVKISNDQYQTIKEVLLLKNHIAVLAV